MSNRKSIKISKMNVRKLAYISIFSGISIFLYMFLKFPLPFFPSFLEINFSMLPIFLVMYLIGYKEALMVVIIRFLFKLGFSGTAGVGETADLLIGLSTVFVGGFYFKHSKRNNKSLIISLVLAILTWIVVGSLTNTFILIPWYIFAFKIDFVAMLNSLYHNINESNVMFYYNLYAVIPFNLLLGSIVSVVTYIVARRLRIIKPKEELEDI